MNERIQQLAEQCQHRYSEHNIDLEKFAELIVKEYEKLLPETCSWNGPADSPMKGWHVAFVARKHFGIEP